MELRGSIKPSTPLRIPSEKLSLTSSPLVRVDAAITVDRGDRHCHCNGGHSAQDLGESLLVPSIYNKSVANWPATASKW